RGGGIGHRAAAGQCGSRFGSLPRPSRCGVPPPGRVVPGRRTGSRRRGRTRAPRRSGLVHPSAHPRDVTALSVGSVRSYVDAGPVGLFLGEVEVTAQVVGYQRRRIGTGEVIDTCPLDLPQRCLRTVAVWWTVSPDA